MPQDHSIVVYTPYASAIVDQSDPGAGQGNVYATIADAIADAVEDIFVRDAGDGAAITIAATDLVQRLQGKDADTVSLPVDLTCNKDDVTFEQLRIPSGTTLALVGVGASVRSLLVTGSGALLLDNGAELTNLHDCRFYECTGVGLQLNGTQLDILISDARFRNFTAVTASQLSITHGSGQAAFRFRLVNCTFDGEASGKVTDYLLNHVFVDGTGVSQFFIAFNDFIAGTEGAINLTGFQGDIVGNLIRCVTLSSGKRGLKLSTPAGTPINVRVALNEFRAQVAADIMFEYVGADADADGLVFALNQFSSGGTVRGAQNMQWIGNDLRNVIVDFQSKTGQVVIGGDMTGATLQNIPADIMFLGVKGQADRNTSKTARVTHSAAQSIGNAAFAAVAFDTERFDNDTIHDTATNNSRLTCKTAGKYLIIFNGVFDASALGSARLVKLILNGATDIAVAAGSPIDATFGAAMNVSCVYDLAVNDYVEAHVYQNSGGGLNIAKDANRSPEFSMVRIG